MVLNIEPNETIGETVANTRHERRSSCTESFSLTILIKFLKFDNDRSDDEHFRLSLHCGGESVSASGTLDSLNEAKLGNVVGLLASGENFMRFLRESTVEVRLSSANSTLYKGELRLSDTKVMKFDPSREGGTLEEETFPIYDGHNEAGTVSMVLRAERNLPSGDPLDTVDIMYRINDHKQMAADEQEAELRPLLICASCNMVRSPGESCCEYEIVDGILHRKSKSSTERLIERIKEKVNQAKLEETLGERASGSTAGCESGGVFCNECGGLTITGTTCQAPDARPSIQRAPSRTSCAIRDNSKSKNGRQRAVKLSNRCCERCQACLDWLPDICCCPRCGYKPEKAKAIKFPVPSLGNDLCDPVPSADRSTPSVDSSGTLLGSSRSCAMCHICQVQCIDCAHRGQQQRAETNSSSAVSVAQLAKQMSYRSATSSRPVTRRPERTSGEQVVQNGNVSAPLLRPMTSKRSEQMANVYSAKEKRDAKESPAKKAPSGKGKVSAREIRKNHHAFLRKIKRQNRPNRYSYRFGRRRSGISVGHRSCMEQNPPPVPAHMGWRWDISPPGIDKPRPGWRPGAVRQPIKQLMQHFLQCYPMDDLPVSCRKAVAFDNGVTVQGDGALTSQKPTLHITKKHGEYTITMNPLKDTETLKSTDDPYLPGKPIKFKLAKDPVLTKLYAMRDTLKRKGLPLCGCKNLGTCAHCTDREKRLLAEEIRRTSKALGLAATTTIADIPSDSESELDVEFTPPSAIMRPELRKRDVVVAETQYNVQDFQLKPVAEERRATKSKSKASETRGERNLGRGDAAATKTQTEAKPAGSAGAKAGVSNPKVRLSGGKTAKGVAAGAQTKPTEPAAKKGGKQK